LRNKIETSEGKKITNAQEGREWRWQLQVI